MGATVTLAGSGTDPDAGDTLAYAWTQPGADSVTLSGASTATATFDAPDGLTEDTTLVFALTVTDAGGLSHQDQVSVTVEGPAPAAVELLTAGVESLPQRHDGSTSFTFELVFSEEVAIGYRTVRDSVFEVTGGEVTRARRHSPPSNMRWVITVVPSSDGDVALVLPSGRSCDSNGAVCTSDGRMLSNRLEPTIEGPAPAAVELLTAGVESLPQRHDGSTSFTFELVFSEEVAIGYRTVRDSVFEVTGGEVTRARRHSPPSNMRWVITVVPSSDGDVVLVLPSGRSCDSNGAVCTSDGRMLSNRLEPTIEGPAPAASPVVSSESAFSVVEGSTAVGVLSAVDADTDVADLVWSMAGGVDASEFSLSASRVLAFLAAKDFEDPDDADGDGTYELTVRVSDGQRAATGDVEVSLANRNEAPTADAGADHTGVAMGATVTLAGSGTDPDAGDTLAYAWTQPGADSVTLSGASTATATFDAPDGLTEDTTLVFALTVTDAGGLSHQDQVSVTVEGPAPADESVEDLAPAVEWGERLMDRDIVLGVSSIPSGLWSNGTDMWIVTNWQRAEVSVYSLADGSLQPRDSLVLPGGNGYLSALWSDDTTLWAADFYGGVRAYRLSDGARVSSEDFDSALMAAAGNLSPSGLWSNGNIMWVGDYSAMKAFAYLLSDKTRVPARDIDLVGGGGAPINSFGIWSNGHTLLTASWLRGEIAAQALSDGQRQPDRDLDTSVIQTHNIAGIWSNGEILWVVFDNVTRVYAFAVPGLD